jgi:ParB family chromosome partitioning protein
VVTAPAVEPGRGVKTVPVSDLQPSPLQPRRNFDDGELKALAASMKESGVLQPLLVRPRPGEPSGYEIVAGERRWRAAQQAGLHEVPVLVRALGDREALELALVENVQRQDLSALEEAEGYRRLTEEFGHTQEDLARRVGKSRSHVANLMRLLGLPEAVKALLTAGKLTAGHARALLNAPEPLALAEEIVAKGLSVRQAEQLAAGAKPHAAKPPQAPPPKDADTAALERDLSGRLGLKVAITPKGQGGTVAIQYRTLEQLDSLLQRLQQAPRLRSV